MIGKLNNIILFTLFAFALALVLYPRYIRLLQRFKAQKTLRVDAAGGGKAEIFNKLHSHKA
jgi:hypothetical protein